MKFGTVQITLRRKKIIAPTSKNSSRSRSFRHCTISRLEARGPRSIGLVFRIPAVTGRQRSQEIFADLDVRPAADVLGKVRASRLEDARDFGPVHRCGVTADDQIEHTVSERQR